LAATFCELSTSLTTGSHINLAELRKHTFHDFRALKYIVENLYPFLERAEFDFIVFTDANEFDPFRSCTLESNK